MNALISPVSLSVSVVIPVYRGEKSLPSLIKELSFFAGDSCTTPAGVPYAIKEVLLVHDSGPDRSDLVLEDLARKYAFVKPVWLSRNFGQHAATLSGMASSSSNWVVTIDEDGQQNPAEIGKMLDVALSILD